MMQSRKQRWLDKMEDLKDLLSGRFVDDVPVERDRSDTIKMIIYDVLFIVYGIVTAVLSENYITDFMAKIAERLNQNPTTNFTAPPNSISYVIIYVVLFVGIYLAVTIGFAAMYIILKETLLRNVTYLADVSSTGIVLGVLVCIVISLLCWFGVI